MQYEGDRILTTFIDAQLLDALLEVERTSAQYMHHLEQRDPDPDITAIKFLMMKIAHINLARLRKLEQLREDIKQ